MKTSHIAIIVVGFALVAALYLSSPREPSKNVVQTSSNGQFFQAASGFLSGLLSSKATVPSAVSYQPPVYVIGEGYVSGGGNAPIDPNTGAVYLPPGESFGPTL